MTHPGEQYLAELEASAKKATPGEWEIIEAWRDFHMVGPFMLDGPKVDDDGRHITNASPDRIAAIVDYVAAEKARADAAEAERDHFRAFAKEATAKMTNYAGGGSELFHSERYGLFLADIEVCIEQCRRRQETQQNVLVRECGKRKAAEARSTALEAERDAAKARADAAERERDGAREALKPFSNAYVVAKKYGTTPAVLADYFRLAHAALSDANAAEREA